MSTMTNAEFSALASKMTRMEPESLEIARAVLVHGRPQKDVAQEYNLTKQRLSQIMRRMMLARADVPAGWMKVEVWLPPSAAREVKAIEERERQALHAEA
mgnify:CR=1 FL=1